MSLTANRNTTQRASGSVLALAVAATTHIFAGALVCVNASGYVVPGSASTALLALGRAAQEVDNSAGADGDLTVRVDRGIFPFVNSATTDAITIADIGKRAYIVDDQTVAKTSGFNTRSVAGRIEDVDAAGNVWVAVGEGPLPTPAKHYVPAKSLDLKNADAATVRIVAPVTGFITRLRGVNDVAVTGADATVQAKIAGVNVTGGLLTWPLAGAAIGQGQTAVPSGANAVTAGDIVSLVTGGGGTQTGNADIIVEFTAS